MTALHSSSNDLLLIIVARRGHTHHRGISEKEFRVDKSSVGVFANNGISIGCHKDRQSFSEGLITLLYQGSLVGTYTYNEALMIYSKMMEDKDDSQSINLTIQRKTKASQNNHGLFATYRG